MIDKRTLTFRTASADSILIPHLPSKSIKRFLKTRDEKKGIGVGGYLQNPGSFVITCPGTSGMLLEKL